MTTETWTQAGNYVRHPDGLYFQCANDPTARDLVRAHNRAMGARDDVKVQLELTLGTVRQQRDMLSEQLSVSANGGDPYTLEHSAPCGDGRCYCGGCVL